MATRRLSGRGLAADIRSGMDCAAVTEKHDLTVAQLKKALGTLVEKGFLSQDDLPSWVNEDKPWKCPKCGRGQSERFPRCPVCGVIFAKLQKSTADCTSSHLSSPFHASTRESSRLQDEPPKSRLSGKLIGTAIGATLLVLVVIAFTRTDAPSKQPAQAPARQADTSGDQTAALPGDISHQDVAYGSLRKVPVEEAILRTPRARRVAQLAQEYRKTHTYSTYDKFACVDMSIDMWNQIQTAGIRAGLMVGNVQTDITGVRAENFIQYIAQMNHAWVVAEIDPGRWLPVEVTAGGIVSPQDVGYWRYFSGEFFSNPGEFKRFEELRRNLFKICVEAQEMHKSFTESLKLHQPRSREAVLEAYRARGKLEQRAHDCKDLLQKIQQVLNDRSEKVVPWTTQ